MAEISGGEALNKKLAELIDKIGDPAVLRVGFLEGSEEPDGTSIPMIAAIQNYGAPAKGIPPRPFFTNMVRDKSPGWGDAIVRILRSNNYHAKATLELMGQGIAGQLRQSIVDTNSPPLSPVTLLLRERFWSNRINMKFGDVMQARRDIEAGVQPSVSGTQAKPLVWEGNLLASVDYEVTSGS